MANPSTRSRIAMISFHTCPLAAQEGKETGGMNVYVLELSKELAKKGITIDIFTRSQDPNNEEIVQISENLRVIHIVAGPTRSVAKKSLPHHLPEFIQNMTAFIQREQLQYQLLHCHYYLSGLIGLELQKLNAAKKIALSSNKKLPLIMTFHTLALMKNLVARGELEKEDTLRIEAEFDLVKKADSIIAPSESDASYLEYLYGSKANGADKVTIIPPGVDTTLFRPMEMSDARAVVGGTDQCKIVLFVGRIEPLKGIDMLMYAIKILTQQSPELSLQLWIVGGDISQPVSAWSHELQKLEQLRKVLDLNAVVKFVGQRSQEQLPYYYNAADVAVMPSHYESFGMAALEAMTCGVPVITTNVTGISGLIDERRQSLITSVNNPLLLASQIQYLLTHEKTHAEIRQELQEKVQNLEWSKVAEQVIKVYKKVSKS